MISSRFPKGLNDFLLQRLTAVLLALYVLCLLGFFLSNSPLDHATVSAFFHSLPMQLFSSIAFLALWSHGSIGLLTVGKDYIQTRGFGRASVGIALLYELGVQVILIAYAAWGLAVVWGVL